MKREGTYRSSGSTGARKVTTSRSRHRDKLNSTDVTDVGKSKQRRQRDDHAGGAPTGHGRSAESEDDSGPEGTGHKRRRHVIDWEYCLPGFYEHYKCNSCRKNFKGKRWHYAQWQLDFCADCAWYCLDSWKEPENPDGILNFKPQEVDDEEL